MRRWLLLSVLALAACKSETMERDPMGLWKPEASAPSSRQEPEPEAKQIRRGTVVTIPADVAKAQADFVNRASTLFADSVEVDLSRNGWLALASFAVAPDAVVRNDQEDRQRGVLTITLQRVPEVPATKDSVPTVRFGDGMRIVGVDRVVLRFWTQQSAERPQWFHAAGAGAGALFTVESDPPKEWRGRAVDVRAEIQRAGDTYRFVSGAEAKP